MTDSVLGSTSEEIQVVAFYLQEEEFAVDIQQLREVLKFTDITPLPRTSDFIEGVINLRGEVIPVIDLRKRFGMEQKEKDDRTRIIIVEIDSNLIGLIVDQVSEVLHLTNDQIEPPPGDVTGTRTDFIMGIGKIGQRLIILLNPTEIVTATEKIQLEKAALDAIKNTA